MRNQREGGAKAGKGGAMPTGRGGATARGPAKGTRKTGGAVGLWFKARDPKLEGSGGKPEGLGHNRGLAQARAQEYQSGWGFVRGPINQDEGRAWKAGPTLTARAERRGQGGGAMRKRRGRG